MTERTILLVDDDFHILNVMTLKLKNAQFNVVTASDGEEALERIRESKPDLVVTDFSMPGMCGLDLVRNIREVEAWNDLPIIMLTARGQIVEEDPASQFMINKIMSKPFSPREMLRHVQEILGAGVH